MNDKFGIVKEAATLLFICGFLSCFCISDIIFTFRVKKWCREERLETAEGKVTVSPYTTPSPEQVREVIDFAKTMASADEKYTKIAKIAESKLSPLTVPQKKSKKEARREARQYEWKLSAYSPITNHYEVYTEFRTYTKNPPEYGTFSETMYFLPKGKTRPYTLKELNKLKRLNIIEILGTLVCLPTFLLTVLLVISSFFGA